MLDPHREIQTLVDNFVAELSDLAKRIAIEQLKTAFGAGAKIAAAPPAPAPARRAARAAAPPARAAAPPARAAAPPARAAAPPAPPRSSRVRRGQREIEALRSKLLATIAEQPGRRAEDINAALGTKTAQIAQPLRRLVTEQLVRTEGTRRGTRYFVVGPADAQSDRRPTSEATVSADASPG